MSLNLSFKQPLTNKLKSRVKLDNEYTKFCLDYAS